MQTTNDAIGGLGSRRSRQFPPIPGEYRPAPPSELPRQAIRTTVSSQTGVHLGNVSLGNRSPADAATMLAGAIRGYCEGSDRGAAGFEPDDMVHLVQKRLGDDLPRYGTAR